MTKNDHNNLKQKLLIIHLKEVDNIYAPGEMASLICLEAEWMCLTSGIRLINHSPISNMDTPIHKETNTPTKNMKRNVVTNLSPAMQTNKLVSSDTHGCG
jgi:hypothetical protein